MRHLVLITLIFALNSLLVNARETGAPASACVGMTPLHNTSLSTEVSPYIFMAAKTADSSEEVTVILITENVATNFEGFLLEARHPETDAIVGTFVSLDPLAQTLDCPGGVQNALTHNSKDAKSSIIATWTPPEGTAMSVNFKVTVVIDEENDYWMHTFAYSSASLIMQASSLVLVFVSLMLVL